MKLDGPPQTIVAPDLTSLTASSADFQTFELLGESVDAQRRKGTVMEDHFFALETRVRTGTIILSIFGAGRKGSDARGGRREGNRSELFRTPNSP